MTGQGRTQKISNYFCPARAGRVAIKSRAGQGRKIGPVDTSGKYDHIYICKHIVQRRMIHLWNSWKTWIIIETIILLSFIEAYFITVIEYSDK